MAAATVATTTVAGLGTSSLSPSRKLNPHKGFLRPQVIPQNPLRLRKFSMKEEVSMATIANRYQLFNRETSFLIGKLGKTQNNKLQVCTVMRSLSSADKHLESLDSFLRKVRSDDAKQPSFTHSITSTDNRLEEKHRAKVDEDVTLRKHISSATDGENLHGSLDTYLKGDYMKLKTRDAEGAYNVSDFYLIGVLASINIAVFLIEMATPMKHSNFELFSLPLVYGAKINNLILVGEWWRLVTPIFLHSGIFHIALGSWGLFTFGLEVSREYGLFTFFLIYILGGISGNLISFLHTPEPTVGGTGPVFAIIGAWLIYRFQNRDVIASDAFESTFQKAILFTGLSCVLSNFGPIDDWSHFGAALTGIAYGFLTCLSLRVKDDTGQQERMTLIRRYANPCKSLLYFSSFLLLLSSLIVIFEPPLYLL